MMKFKTPKVTTQTRLTVLHDDLTTTDLLNRLSGIGVHVTRMDMSPIQFEPTVEPKSMPPCHDGAVWEDK